MGKLHSPSRGWRWVRVSLVVVGMLLLAAGTGGVGIYRLTDARLERYYRSGPVLRLESNDTARGRHVATSVSLCSKCHGADFGGQVMVDNPVMRLAAPNLTTGKGGRPADWSGDDWARAIRHGIRRAGTPLLVMPSTAYAGLSDLDLAALIAYLRTRAPVDRDLGRSRLKLPGRVLMVAGEFDELAAEKIDHSRSLPAFVSQDDGGYLVRIAGCTMCHQADLSGSEAPIGPPGAPKPPAINRVALAGWTLLDFEKALRHGQRPDGRAISTFMPWTSFAGMSDAEVAGIWHYIQQTPPVDSPVPEIPAP